MKEDEWQGCYDSHKWKKLATPDSNAHPAKMAWGLLERIFKHLLKEGILKYGDVVLDPMGGTGRTALAWCAMHRDNRAVTVELEQKFIEMQFMNKVHAERLLNRKLNWLIVKGDARDLTEILTEHGYVGVTSPPYGHGAKGVKETSQESWDKRTDKSAGGPLGQSLRQPQGYSDDPKNIGNLKDVVAVTSPPYGEMQITSERSFAHKDKDGSIVGKKAATAVIGKKGYSSDERNIGNCPDKPVVITSPPYGDAEKRDRSKEASFERDKKFKRGDRNISLGCGDDPQNIARLPDKKPVVVTSPPYADAIRGGEGPNVPAFWKWAKEQCDGQWPIPKERMRELSNQWQREHEGYSNDEDNIGNLKDAVVVTSPPYPTQSGGTNVTSTEGPLSDGRLLNRHAAGNLAAQGYGEDDKNLGNLKDEEREDEETYLDAMYSVYQECAQVCRYLITVTKNPTRKGNLRRLDTDTKMLMENVGFKVIEWVKARLFKVRHQQTLFGEGVKKEAKGRLSFFKRLQFDKGNPVAEWEDILIAVRE